VTHRAAVALGLPVVERLFQGIQNKVHAHRVAYASAHDAPRVHVDHEGHVQPTLSDADVGEVRGPELVGPIGLEDAIDPVQRVRRLGIADGGAHHLAPAHALQTQAAHEPLARAARRHDAFAVHLLPDLVCTVDLHVDVPHALNARRQGAVAAGALPSRVGFRYSAAWRR